MNDEPGGRNAPDARDLEELLSTVYRFVAVKGLSEEFDAWVRSWAPGVDPNMFAEVGRFQIGDRVEKYTGDYQLTGEVRAVFSTKAGNIRYVVEHEPGFLHIYSDRNLRKA